MVVPGFSISDLIQAVDKSVKLIVSLKEAPDDLQEVIERIEFNRGVLKSWERQINENSQETHEDDLTLLVGVKAKYDSIIQELEDFNKKYPNLANGEWRARVNWAFNEHFRKERAGLEEKLKKVETRMNTVLQTLTWGTSREILKRTSGFAQTGLGNSVSRQTHQTPKLLREASLPSSLQNLSERAEQLPCVSDNRGTSQQPLLPCPSSSLFSPSHSDQSTICWDPGFNISHSLRQDGRIQAVEMFPKNAHTPPQSPNSGYGVEGDMFHVRSASVSTVGTPSYAASPFSLMSTPSSVATDYSLVETNRLSISSIALNQLPGCQYYNSAVGSVSSGQVKPPSSPSSISTATLPMPPAPAPLSRPLPPPKLERMPFKGEIKIWYRQDHTGPYYHRQLCDLDIAWGSERGATEVQMTYDGGAIVHRGSANRTIIAETILTQPRNLISHVRKVDSGINYLVTFIGQHKLYKGGKRKAFFTGSVEYSFTHETDYQEFQRLITGKINLLNVGILTISGKDVISDFQVLQFWDNEGTRTIRFFRNAGDQNFSEYETARLKKCSSTKKSLVLQVQSGSPNDNVGELKIEFLTKSQKDDFIRLAQFSNG